jgi:hypothetical protein
MAKKQDYVLTYEVKRDAEIPGVGLVAGGSAVTELQVSEETAKPLMAEGVLRPVGHLLAKTGK